MIKNSFLCKLLFLLLVVFLPTKVFASVVINEIAWMGTKSSFSDEWIELYNNSSSSVNLKNWKLIVKHKSLKIHLKGLIKAQDFYLLERTDDNTLPNVSANQIYKGSLNNKGEHLQLINTKNNVVDEVDCLKGWFRGNNETKQTMERKNSKLPGYSPDSWQTSQISEGTPKAKNSTIKKEEVLLQEKNQGSGIPVSVEEEQNKKQLAMINERISNKSGALGVSLIASFVALFCGIMILLLKKRRQSF